LEQAVPLIQLYWVKVVTVLTLFLVPSLLQVVVEVLTEAMAIIMAQMVVLVEVDFIHLAALEFLVKEMLVVLDLVLIRKMLVVVAVLAL
jgi:hypothetical protein